MSEIEKAVEILKKCANNQECRDLISDNENNRIRKCLENKKCMNIRVDCLRNKKCNDIWYSYWIYKNKGYKACREDYHCSILLKIFKP